MLVLLTILVVLSAVVSFAVLLRNRQTPSLKNFPGETEIPPYRPLFAPDEEEIRALEREEKVRLTAKVREKEHRLAEGKIERARSFQKVWQAAPDKLKTVELLQLAAESENGKVYAEISVEVVKAFYENRLENLPKNDLADLLDSHFRLLPQQERASGALFRLKEDIAVLRRQPEDKQS